MSLSLSVSSSVLYLSRHGFFVLCFGFLVLNQARRFHLKIPGIQGHLIASHNAPSLFFFLILQGYYNCQSLGFIFYLWPRIEILNQFERTFQWSRTGFLSLSWSLGCLDHWLPPFQLFIGLLFCCLPSNPSNPWILYL